MIGISSDTIYVQLRSHILKNKFALKEGLYTVQCTVHCTVHCTLYTLYCKVYSTLCTVHSVLYTVQYTMYMINPRTKHFIF